MRPQETHIPYWKPGADPAPQVDFYSLGVIAYQLLLGDVTVGLRSDWRTDLKEIEVPEPIVSLIDRCVAHPSRRFAYADALVTETEALPDGGLFKAPPPSPELAEQVAPVTFAKAERTKQPEQLIAGAEETAAETTYTTIDPGGAAAPEGLSKSPPEPEVGEA